MFKTSGNLSVDDDQTNNNRSVSRSRSSNIGNASVRRKSFQENGVAGMVQLNQNH